MPEIVRAATAWMRRHPLLMIFILAIVVYNLNMRPVASVDTIAASRMPFSILEYNDLYMDHYMNYYGDPILWPGQVLFSQSHDHYLSYYPIVTPLLVTPIYVVPYAGMKAVGVPVDMTSSAFRALVMMMEKFSASIIAAAGCVIMYMVARRLFRPDIALLTTLIYAFATETWAISSQGLWQHGVSELFMLLSLLVVLMNEKKPAIRNYVFLGILSALYVFNRPLDSILILPIIAYVVYPFRKDTIRSIACYVLSAAAISLPFIAYNLYFFDSVLGWYDSAAAGMSLSNLSVGLAGILVSPSRGLFVYTSIALLAIPGILYIRSVEDKRTRTLLYMSVIAVSLFLLAVGSYFEWWGGGCYGPRYLTDIVPFLAIFIGLFLNHALAGNFHKLLIAVIALLIILSVIVQMIGVFFYPNGGYKWDDEPGLHDGSLIWSLSDTQIARSINAGVWNPFSTIVDYIHRMTAGS